jgi:hypothetical protein
MLRLCTIPMANVLTFGLYLYVVRSRRGEKDSFVFGFAVFDFTALAAFLYGCEAFPASLNVAGRLLTLLSLAWVLPGGLPSVVLCRLIRKGANRSPDQAAGQCVCRVGNPTS